MKKAVWFIRPMEYRRPRALNDGHGTVGAKRMLAVEGAAGREDVGCCCCVLQISLVSKACWEGLLVF